MRIIYYIVKLHFIIIYKLYIILLSKNFNNNNKLLHNDIKKYNEL